MDNHLKAILGELNKFSLFESLSDQETSALCDNGIVRFCKHREEIFSFGKPADYFGIVLSGAYKLSRLNPMGEESVIHFCAPGEVIAALVMAQKNSTYPVTVKAMGPSRILILKKENYTQNWLVRPELILKIQSQLSTRMSLLQNQKLMQRAPVSAKVAAFLLQYLMNHEHDSNDDQLIIPVPLTRKEIGDALGLSVETVIRTMSDWGKKDIISSTDQMIKVKNVEFLISESEVIPD